MTAVPSTTYVVLHNQCRYITFYSFASKYNCTRIVNKKAPKTKTFFDDAFVQWHRLVNSTSSVTDVLLALAIASSITTHDKICTYRPHMYLSFSGRLCLYVVLVLRNPRHMTYDLRENFECEVFLLYNNNNNNK